MAWTCGETDPSKLKSPRPKRSSMAGVLVLSIAGVVGSDKSKSDGSASTTGCRAAGAATTRDTTAGAASGSDSLILINRALSLVSNSFSCSAGLSAGFFSFSSN